MSPYMLIDSRARAAAIVSSACAGNLLQIRSCVSHTQITIDALPATASKLASLHQVQQLRMQCTPGAAFPGRLQHPVLYMSRCKAQRQRNWTALCMCCGMQLTVWQAL